MQSETPRRRGRVVLFGPTDQLTLRLMELGGFSVITLMTPVALRLFLQREEGSALYAVIFLKRIDGQLAREVQALLNASRSRAWVIPMLDMEPDLQVIRSHLRLLHP